MDRYARVIALEDSCDGGNCATMDGLPPNWFFPDDEIGSRSRHSRGVLVCQGCPVLDACLEYAALTGVGGYGVWGGLRLTNKLTAERAHADTPAALATRRQRHFDAAVRDVARNIFLARHRREPRRSHDHEEVRALSRQIVEAVESGDLIDWLDDHTTVDSTAQPDVMVSMTDSELLAAIARLTAVPEVAAAC